MLKALLLGGLGDSILQFAKLQSKYTLKEIQENISIDYCDPRWRENKVKSIIDFWQSQGVQINAFPMPTLTWIDDNKHTYDIMLIYPFNEPHKENNYLQTNPFPKIKYTHIPNIDIVIQPYGGTNLASQISFTQLMGFTDTIFNRTIHYIGWTNPAEENIFRRLQGKSLLNQGNLVDFMNTAASAKIYIGFLSFGAFLTAMNKQQIFYLNRTTKDHLYLCFEWNATNVHNLSEIHI